jgi:predicted dehydrogenase
MKSSLNRRLFLKRAAVTAGALATVPSLPNILRAASTPDKLNCVLIGCGGRGGQHLEEVVATAKQNLVAIVDPSEVQQANVRKWLQGRQLPADKLQAFGDYRKMFDKIGKQVDAVFIATPNHQHAVPALMAMQLGKNVYCEKPVSHNVAEARRLREVARQYKVATQMGNQGHCLGGYHRLCEFIWGGVIGQVTETHSWTDRANGGEGPRPPATKPPAGMDWDLWIGPAPYRDYHEDLHPHEWHGWYDFGNGSIGNLGCHVLDGVFWALKIEHPTSIEEEQVRGGSNERYPLGSRIRWDVPARGDMAPVKVYWYEGLNPTTKDKPQGASHAAKGNARNFPPLLLELDKKYPDEELTRGDSGTIYVGEKGIIFTQTYGNRMRLIPSERMKEITQPPQTLPRPKQIFTDFIEACLAGKTDTFANFDYGTRLTEFTILGNLAQRAGEGKKVIWDGPNMRVTNDPGLNQWLKRDYRAGWTV